jgi:hypothetical protein
MGLDVNRWPQKAIDGHRTQKMGIDVNRWPQNGHRRQ